MKLNIQLFGGRGASGSKKIYTSKDIKSIKKYYSSTPTGYELNGFYLLKDYYGLRTTEHYNWIINKTGNTYQWSGDRSKAIDKGEAINVDNFKNGKEILIRLANNKKLWKTKKIVKGRIVWK